MVINKRTFALIKPHAMANEMGHQLLSAILMKGFMIVRADTVIAKAEMVREHYREKAGQPYFEPMVAEFVGKDVLAMILHYESATEEQSAAKIFKEFVGPTNPKDANEFQLRYLLRDAVEIRHKGIHASDDDNDIIRREAAIWLPGSGPLLPAT